MSVGKVLVGTLLLIGSNVATWYTTKEHTKNDLKAKEAKKQSALDDLEGIITVEFEVIEQEEI